IRLNLSQRNWNLPCPRVTAIAQDHLVKGNLDRRAEIDDAKRRPSGIAEPALPEPEAERVRVPGEVKPVPDGSCGFAMGDELALGKGGRRCDGSHVQANVPSPMPRAAASASSTRLALRASRPVLPPISPCGCTRKR